MSQIYTIHTDGACIGNPGPGGYGAVIDGPDGVSEISQGYLHTTNNRMEILAVIRSIEATPEKSIIEIHSDSQYVVNAINKHWATKWRAANWQRGRGQPALNPDLWARLLNLLTTRTISFKWVRSHSGNPGNERADRLAVAAIHAPGQIEDRVAVPEPAAAPPVNPGPRGLAQQNADRRNR